MMNNEPKYPEIEVQLSEEDGNAFAIASRVMAALKSNGVTLKERDAFLREAMAGDYTHLLRTCADWVTVL